MTNDITSIKATLEMLKRENELLVTGKAVDPVYEVAGVSKALEDGPAVLFENIKGYPGQKLAVNVLGKRERNAKIFGVSSPGALKFKCLEAIKNPLPPRVVSEASSQEVVLTGDLDVLKTLPVTQVMETDAGRIISGGISLVSGPEIGHCIAFRRTHFRGKDWASMSITPESHIGSLLPGLRERHEKLPFTLNIGCPPAVMVLAARTALHWGMPAGTDELAVAGRLQEAPVEICKAKTVDAYSLAKAEWVIEGYFDPSQLVWESAEAEKTGDEHTPYFVEWLGYQGWSRHTGTFHATAITHRKDQPIFYASLAECLEGSNMAGAFAEAIMIDIYHRLGTDLVKDVNILDCMHGSAGLVVQIKKRTRAHDDFPKSAIMAAFAASSYLRSCIVVDEDINIYSAEDVMWALTTRVDPKRDILMIGSGNVPGDPGFWQRGKNGKMGIDATYPFDHKVIFNRRKYPAVNLEDWFSREEIDGAQARQNEYARFIAESRY